MIIRYEYCQNPRHRLWKVHWVRYGKFTGCGMNKISEVSERHRLMLGMSGEFLKCVGTVCHVKDFSWYPNVGLNVQIEDSRANSGVCGIGIYFTPFGRHVTGEIRAGRFTQSVASDSDIPKLQIFQSAEDFRQLVRQ